MSIAFSVSIPIISPFVKLGFSKSRKVEGGRHDSPFPVDFLPDPSLRPAARDREPVLFKHSRGEKDVVASSREPRRARCHADTGAHREGHLRASMTPARIFFGFTNRMRRRRGAEQRSPSVSSLRFGRFPESVSMSLRRSVGHLSHVFYRPVI